MLIAALTLRSATNPQALAVSSPAVVHAIAGLITVALPEAEL
jgi:hypothetical protein